MGKLEFEKIRHGIVCFTFDDSQFPGWLDAMELFEKYNAHATFFVSGEVDGSALAAMRALKAAGHSVGLHSLHHADAPEYFENFGSQAYFENEVLPQLAACKEGGVELSSFAYPNNLRDDGTDGYLGKHFSRFRAGLTGAGENEIYVPLHRLPENRIMHGFGIGEYYHTVEQTLLDQLRHAAETNTCVTFFSHNIAPNAKSIHMPSSLLESALRECQSLGVIATGLDELK